MREGRSQDEQSMQMEQYHGREGLPEISVSGILTLESVGAVTAAPVKGLHYTSQASSKSNWAVIHETNNSNLALLLS